VSDVLQAPFVWFGGKSRAAPPIWPRLGEVANYVEPFAGSLAVLLGSPRISTHETVNDLDGFICNAWRAIAQRPDEVAQHADWPVNECDLHARHAWLVGQRDTLTHRLEGDPDFCDAKIAGWWLWGIASWIGSGWCSGKGPWHVEDGLLVKADRGNAGQGVNRKRPHLGNAGQGVNRKRPHLGNAQGVNRQLEACDGPPTLEWMRELSDRLRRVRVCCGDWKRVCGPSPTTKLGMTAVVLDPPYSEGERDMDLYSCDSGTVAADVRAWAIAHGDDPLMRIVLCGYDSEHSMHNGWECVEWKANGGYASQGDGSNDNAERETLWFSPHCLRPGADIPKQLGLGL